jgi:hypothetical protein
MLNWIVQFSLRFRGVVVLACVLTGYGIYTAAHAKLDVLPNFVPPEVEVETEAPGISPEQVEILVTRPLENTINGLGNMASLRSESIAGLVHHHGGLPSGNGHFHRPPDAQRTAGGNDRRTARRRRAAGHVTHDLRHHGPAENRAGLHQPLAHGTSLAGRLGCQT